MPAGMTLHEAALAMTPPIPRRELARRLKGVKPVGEVWGRTGRRPRLYPVGAIFQAHAAWMAERTASATVVGGT